MMFRRAAPLRPTANTLDREARTVSAIAATEVRVPRAGITPAGEFGAWGEVLRMDGADLSRFIGAPLLLDHRNAVDSIAGVVESASIRGAELHVRIRFARNDRGEQTMAMVADGTLSGVSIGYRVERYEVAPKDRTTFIARTWAPLELSLVPIPADDAARVRSANSHPPAPQEHRMSETTNAPAPAADATRAERERIASLEMPLNAARAAGVDAIVADAMRTRAIEEGWDANRLRAGLFDVMTRRAERDLQADAELRAVPPILPTPVAQYQRSYDDPTFRMAQRAEALACQSLSLAPSDAARQFMAARGFTGMAAAILEESGVKVRGLSDGQLIAEVMSRRAHTTTDFPALLMGAGDRAVSMLREAAASPIRAVCQPREVVDFRPFAHITAAGPSQLKHLTEGGGVEYTTFYESKETAQLATYARNVAITRQMLVNDDLGALTAAARFWASGIAATERALFLAMFAANSAGGGGHGPTMADGEPLFSAAHGNAVAGTASTTGIANARKAMREQVDLNGNLLAVGPAVLLSGPTSETGLEQAVSSITIATAEANRPIFAGLSVVVEAGLTGAPFFGFAAPSASPVLEYVTLAGRNGVPAFEEFTGPDRDGVVLRCIHDVAIAACGWVGAVRVSGA